MEFGMLITRYRYQVINMWYREGFNHFAFELHQKFMSSTIMQLGCLHKLYLLGKLIECVDGNWRCHVAWVWGRGAV